MSGESSNGSKILEIVNFFLKFPRVRLKFPRFYVLDKETNQKVQVHKKKNQRSMKMLAPRNRVKKLEGITEI